MNLETSRTIFPSSGIDWFFLNVFSLFMKFLTRTAFGKISIFSLGINIFILFMSSFEKTNTLLLRGKYISCDPLHYIGVVIIAHGAVNLNYGFYFE